MKNTFILSRRCLSFFCSICLLLYLSSCGAHLQQLAQAQKDFNKGSELELEQLLTPPTPPVLEKPASFYESALQTVNKALQNKAGLDKDSVGVLLYTIKALCEWKLGHFDVVDKSIKDADVANQQLERKGIALPRDAIQIKALPHLVEASKIKKELDTLAARKTRITHAVARQNFNKLIFEPGTPQGRLELVINTLINLDRRNNQQMDIYLTNATLAVFKTWSDAYDYLRSAVANDTSLSDGEKDKLTDERDKEREQDYAQKGDKEILRLEKLLPDNEESRQIIAFWRRILGIPKRR